MMYAAIDGWRRQMVQHGHDQLAQALNLAHGLRAEIDAIDGLQTVTEQLVRAEASHDLDPLHVLIDVAGLGISGYQAADWLRAECRVDVGLNDHRRIEATLSQADDDDTADRLVQSLTALAKEAPSLPTPPPVSLPRSADLEMDTVMLPREAFFGPIEVVPADEAAGRVAAEQITPYPPGIPAILPGERINARVVEYLRTGAEAGMVLPDPADPTVKTIRVVRA
jgi:lysine decarboxylase